MDTAKTRFLITGATGNVGAELLSALIENGQKDRIIAGVRSLEQDALRLPTGVKSVLFDFDRPSTFSQAFSQCEVLFLLRPPHISDVKKYFTPLIAQAAEHKLKHIVFLSVQGADKNSIIPHHKIEKLIQKSGIPYTFLRPAYFMQNFTTTLKADLLEKDLIYLPAGKALFTLVDLEDLGKAAAKILINPKEHANKAYDLTSSDLLTFYQMAKILGKEMERDIRFESPNLLSFFFHKKRQSLPSALILVMMMIHYLPRFSSPPERSDALKRINGKPARNFESFVQKNRSEWTKTDINS